MLRLRAVGNGIWRVEMHDGAGSEGLLTIIARLRFDTVDLAMRGEFARRERRSGKQAAAAQAYEQCVKLAHFLDQLLRRRTLTRDHMRMVIGRNQGQSVLGGQ